MQNESKLRKDFWDTINNPKKVNLNLLTDDDIATYTIGERKDVIMVIYVPMEDLNYDTIHGYRNSHRTLKEGHPFERLNDHEEDIIRDPYVLEFLGLSPNDDFYESDLEQALITHLQKFLLELG